MSKLNNMILRKYAALTIRKDAMVNDEEGQGLVEYALIIALVSIACVVALGLLGTAINGRFTSITGSL